MSFALRSRCIISSEFKKLNRMPNIIRPESVHSAEDILRSQSVQYSMQNVHPVLRPHQSVFCRAISNLTTDNHSSNSAYPIYNACLGPFIDSRFWFADTNNDSLKEEQFEAYEKTEHEVSLEDIRKALKEKRLRLAESPPASAMEEPVKVEVEQKNP